MKSVCGAEMPTEEPVKRIYIDKHLYFEVRPESGWVALKYKGKTVRKRRIKEVYRAALFNAFEKDLAKLEEAVSPASYSEARIKELEKRVDEISRKIDKILKRMEELVV